MQTGRHRWRPAARFSLFADRLRREAAQRSADVSLAQPLEGAIPQLANAFTGDAEHGADFLERMFAAPFETEVEAQYFRVARRKRGQRELDFVGEEAIHRFFFRVGHFVGDEALDE